MNKRQKIIIVVVIILLAALVTYFLVSKKSSPVQYGAGADGPTIVAVDNTQGLESILLATQFGAVRQAIVDYIHSNIGKGVSLATIVGQPQIKSDSTVVFSVETDSPKKTFEVTLGRKKFDRIEFGVTGTSYNLTLYPYKSTNSP